ncbi:DUF4129 domain-containing protein [Georgenia sp. TF02-10]|uniref:DUF4129 domain-containing protein n=1 Tax=Georgenia sp. TF02-10 TaxID=2917725 RepID=UPI001FA7B1DA|nr:DUF4129 domain-containing protein [Georgenia sp. TF02-10]UNX55811.1 DUF4129 domain-containing protein [Georgenia sp. TF02-10]
MPDLAGWAGLSVPVDPDAAEAREWATEELANAAYDDEPSLVERAIGWLVDLIERLWDLGGSAPPSLVPVLLVLALVGLVVLARVLGGRVQRRRAPTGTRSVALFDDARTSADLLAAADAAAARGDYATAVLERFRGLVRRLDERGALDDRPGLTAHEAAGLAGAARPDLAADLGRAGRLFDDVCYGHAAPGPGEDAALRELVARLDRPAAGADPARGREVVP